MSDTVSSKSTNDDHNTTTVGQEHFSQDVNTDEALSVSNSTFNSMAQMNLKRTYDLHQTLDTDAILASRRHAAALEQQQMRHAEDQHQQRLRHAESEHVVKLQTMQTGSVGSSAIVENIARDTAVQILSAVTNSK